MTNWLKNNWSSLLVFIVILSAALWIKGKFDESNTEEVKQQYIKQMEEQRKSFDSQIKQLNKISEEALAKQKELALQHQQTLENLQQQFDEKVSELEELRKLKVKEFTKKLTDDPEVAVEELAHKFGLEVVVIPEGAYED
jgi:Skp family chaperone for outer membrane proteins